jgi:hypothetical protein
MGLFGKLFGKGSGAGFVRNDGKIVSAEYVANPCISYLWEMSKKHLVELETPSSHGEHKAEAEKCSARTV